MTAAAEELEYRLPFGTGFLLRSAARRLPEQFAERYEEEWIAECLAARDGRTLSALRFAISIRLSIRATARPLFEASDDERALQSDEALADPWVIDPAAAAETLRKLLERHAAPPIWADVLAAMREETSEVDAIVGDGLERSEDALISAFDDAQDEMYKRLKAARRNPLGSPTRLWPRADSVRQLWQVSDVRELENEHLQNELNWLVDSELRRARYAFGSVELPYAMLVAMSDTGHQAAARSLAAWQMLASGQRPTLDSFVRSRVRAAYNLQVVVPPPDPDDRGSAGLAEDAPRAA